MSAPFPPAAPRARPRRRAVPTRALAAGAWLALGAGLPGAAGAGGLQVAPLRLDLSPRRPVTQIELTNLESKPVTAQVEVNAWRIANGVDALSPTTDIQFVPPIVSVPPGGHRTVRLRLRAAPELDAERSYRVFIQELTVAPNLGEADLNELASGAQINVRFGVPLFVQPARRAVPQVATTADRGGPGGALRVTVQNPGQVHLRVATVAAFAAGQAPDQPLPAPLATAQRPPGGGLYVMPGQAVTWTFAAGQVAPGSALLVQTDAYSNLGHGALLPSGRVWLAAP